MGKLIAKTALCTLSVLIGLALLVFGVVSLAAPSAMLAISDDLGMDKLSAAYSVDVCERTEKIEDLAEAVERNYNVSNYSECAKYGAKLLPHATSKRRGMIISIKVIVSIYRVLFQLLSIILGKRRLLLTQRFLH